MHGWLEMLIDATQMTATALDSAAMALDMAARGEASDPDAVEEMRQELERERARVDDELKRFQAAHEIAIGRRRK